MSEYFANLSVVIPVRAKRSDGPVRSSVFAVISRTPPMDTRNIEITVVDGSTDTTVNVVRQGMNEIPGLRLVSNGGNRGKDYSVRHGARRRITLFTHVHLFSPIGSF